MTLLTQTPREGGRNVPVQPSVSQARLPRPATVQ